MTFSYEREAREPKRATPWGITWRMGAAVGLTALSLNVATADEDGSRFAQRAERVVDTLHVPLPDVRPHLYGRWRIVGRCWRGPFSSPHYTALR